MKRIILFVFLMTAPAFSAIQDTTVLRLAHGLNVHHPVHKGMEYMAKRVKEKSNGDLQVDIYPSGQLGNEKECLEAIQLGYLAMTKISSGPLESFVPEFKVFGIPYLFRSSKHYWTVLNGEIGKTILNAGTDEKRLKGLCYYDAGARSFYAEQPIETPSDLKGLKVRVMKSPMAQEMIDTMGGVPTPISWGELYTALDQGVVDAAENNPPSFVTSRHYEICKYYSLDEHVRLPDVLVMSTRRWRSLSPEHQKILQEAANESVEYQRKIWRQAEKDSLETLKENGVEIIRPDKEPFIESVQPMWEKYKRSEIGDLIEKIQNVEVE